MDPSSLSVTALYAGLCAILLLAFAGLVVTQRYRVRAGIGDGQDPKLAQAIRIHGNAAEYMPICLILIALLEVGGTATMALHALGAALIIGRISHAIGLWRSQGTSPYRAFGMLSTWGIMIVAGIWNIAHWLMA